MNALFKKLLKSVAYIGAAVVIVLAIGVGIFRLMLPRLPEYQEEIKGWAGAAIGMEVDFSGMNARWRLSGPELSFFDASLRKLDSGESILLAEEVSVGVGLLRLLADRELVVDRVSVTGSAIDLRQDESGRWLVQGLPFDELLGSRDMTAQQTGNVEFIGQNIAFRYEHPASGEVVPFAIRSLAVSRKHDEVVAEADINLPAAFGSRLEISVSQLDNEYADSTWRFFIIGESIELSGWSRLQPVGLPEIGSGTADLSLWLDVDDGQIQHAISDLRVSNLRINDAAELAPIDLSGELEFSDEPEGWLLGASKLRLTTANGAWPESNLQVRIINAAPQTGPDSNDSVGKLRALRGNASYFNLNDLEYVSAWIPEAQRSLLSAYAPSGILRDLSVDLSELSSANPRFDVAAELLSAGFASVDGRPGVRDFTGRVRADRDGGRAEFEATDMRIDLGEYLTDPVLLNEAFGTIIWRRNLDGILVLSDSIDIRNTDFESQLSLQVSLPEGDAAPVVDFESRWSVYDVSVMHRYLPRPFIKPALRQWLTDALVSGRVSQGTTRLNGALDKFPFEDGDGVFRIDARLEDTTLEYSDKWPAPEFSHLDIVVDGMRLYSEVNAADNLGNAVENASLEIADLRDPVLTIDAFATGTMDSIKRYVANSPINDVLGGQVDRVDVGGNASFDLAVTYPIQDKDNYDFSTNVRVSDAVVRVQGFAPPITELNGVVNVSRDDASAEELTGRFLGQSVDLNLTRVGDDTAPHSVVLEAQGSTTTEALSAEFGVSLDSVLAGNADYLASVRFPNTRGLVPGPLQISVESDLFGLQADLPAPLGKADDVALPMSFEIEFPRQQEITALGKFGADLSWSANFLKTDDVWDFDRGVLAVGGEQPLDPDVRGLHIHGQTAELDLHSWLEVGRRGNQQLNLGERIRAIDLTVERFYAIGQTFSDHRIDVKRGGQGWRAEITGAEASGLITIPYDFDSGRAMTLEMDRLILPGDGEEPLAGDQSSGAPTANGLSPDTSWPDPRTLPAISIRAADFGLGLRRLGQLEAEIERTDRGLESVSLQATDATYTVTGSAGWIVDAAEPSGQRTFFDATLKSTNAQETFNRLDYQSGIIGDAMTVDLEVGWTGGPRKDFMGLLNGDVSVSLGAGRLADIEPGAGRVFGLMSFVALPRRLSLDFRDVFDSGFSFDRITGSFRLQEGEAYTCDLTVVGTAADVGIVGRTGLAARDYDQSVIVSANVGNTLPVVGGLIGGPQVAAALFVFSQIFKKPLKDVGQAYYSVAGSWDGPEIDRVDSQRFVETSSLASCIDVSQ